MNLVLGTMGMVSDARTLNLCSQASGHHYGVRAPPSICISGGFPVLGLPFLGPHNKDYSILGSILGSPYLGKLPSRSMIGFHSVSFAGKPPNSNPKSQAPSPNRKFQSLNPKSCKPCFYCMMGDFVALVICLRSGWHSAPTKRRAPVL